MEQLPRIGSVALWLLSLAMPAWGWVLNNPYPSEESDQKIFYSSFTEQPKTLDPAKSYSFNEYLFVGQTYEPVLQYDYFIRPYQLIPLTAARMPQVRFLDKNFQTIHAPESGLVGYSVYTIDIQPGIYFQPHPAFACDPQGGYRYHDLPPDFLDENDITQLSDFKYTGTRELIADDYLYQIKRLANPALNSPVYGLLSDYVVGFKAFAATLPQTNNPFLDLRQFPLQGLKKLSRYRYEVTLKGHYPQFLFWLAMPFFSPIPWEADVFYRQPGMDDKNLNLSWYPIGTGPFMLTENNPNSRMVLDKNPHFHAEYFPNNGTAEDKRLGYLQHQNERLPLIDKAIYTLEKESIPRWNKFLQGYYDMSGVSNDSFDQTVTINRIGGASLSPPMQAKGMRLSQAVDPTVYYLGFNMLDPLVGGDSERARKLRQAISIAINYEENIAIFYNGRGRAAQGPIAPGIPGFTEGEQGINRTVYTWDGTAPKRLSVDLAKEKLNEAGYPNGIDPTTGHPLILTYDVAISGSPDDKARFDWMRKQFAQIGLELNVQATQYNRFQEKMRSGNAQIYSWGWVADYPDPENFLFLLYGPNGKVKYGGENASNYHNARFDQWFNRMKNLPNGPARLAMINQMLALVRNDAPWVWGINTTTLTLSQQWVSPLKASTIGVNTLKYIAIDIGLRNTLRNAWNRPVLWPLGLFTLLLVGLLIPFFIAYRQRQRSRAVRINA